MRGTKKDRFSSGVLILSLSAIIVKIIGLIYKIPMLRLLGSEGMGYFNSAYELYTLFCTVATTGLPVAMSVMIAREREGGARAILRAAMKLFFALGIVGGVIMIAFAKPFALFLGNGGAAYSILAIAPTVLLICLSGAFRGYFQGKSLMAPTAISQVIEALGKLILGLIFAFVALRAGFSVEVVAAFAVLGLTLGTLVSVVYLALVRRLEDKAAGEPYGEVRKGILSELLRTAIPVTLSSAVVSVTKVIDMSMILRRLQDMGQSSEAAFAAYGNYTTLALPLFSLAPALISSVALPLIPSLSGAVGRGDGEEQVRVVGEAMKLTSIISMPMAFGLTLFARPILKLLFSGEEVAIGSAAPLLCILGLSVWLSCMITLGNAVLQALGRAHIPVISMASGSLVKIALAYFLIGNGSVGILGAPISTFFCDFIINAVNLYFICRAMPRMPGFVGVLLRPTLAAAVSVTVARLIYNILASRVGESTWLTLGSIALAAVLYFGAALIMGAVGREELSRLPLPRRLLNRKEKREI